MSIVTPTILTLCCFPLLYPTTSRKRQASKQSKLMHSCQNVLRFANISTFGTYVSYEWLHDVTGLCFPYLLTLSSTIVPHLRKCDTFSHLLHISTFVTLSLIDFLSFYFRISNSLQSPCVHSKKFQHIMMCVSQGVSAAKNARERIQVNICSSLRRFFTLYYYSK